MTMTIAMTVEQAVEVSGLSRTMLYSLFKEGKITPRKCGNRTLVMTKELEEFLRNLPTTNLRHSA